MLIGKNAIVTGARTGIGKAIVYKFVQSGVNVWAVVHREDKDWLEEIQMIAMVHNVWIRPIYIDLNDEAEIAIGIKQIIQERILTSKQLSMIWSHIATTIRTMRKMRKRNKKAPT